jgi:hypothetical protein
LSRSNGRVIGSSLLAALFAGNLVNAKYTVQIPDDAIWVTTWEQYHADAPQFGKTVLYKYGGFVVEVDDKIVLATDEKMTKEIHDLLTGLEKDDAESESQPQTPNRRNTEIRGLRNKCSHPPCFGPGICTTYSHCHVCTGLTGGVFKRGRCI